MASRRYSDDELRAIYDRTRGKCHICHYKVAFTNYGILGARMAWEVDHSRAQANGGTHRLNNLYAACIPCNRSKGKTSTRVVRGRNGWTRAPLSRQKHEQAVRENTAGAAITGGLLGFRLGGPPGALLGAIAGAIYGSGKDPDED